MGILKAILRIICPDLLYGNMSDEELNEEREPYRIKTVSEDDTYARAQMESIDRVLRKRRDERYRQENPDAQPRNKEHGWYLPEDDD